MDFTAIKYQGQGSFMVEKGAIGKLLFLLKTIGIFTHSKCQWSFFGLGLPLLPYFVYAKGSSKNVQYFLFLYSFINNIWAVAWDFQQFDTLKSVDSDEPVQPPLA